MAGKLVRSTGNGSTLTIPQNVFSAGDMISVFNVSTGDNTIAQGAGATLYNTADGATGNRTLAAKGVCTIVCTSTNEFIISGSQVKLQGVIRYDASNAYWYGQVRSLGRWCCLCI